MKLLRATIAISLLLLVTSVPLSQNRNGSNKRPTPEQELDLRKRLARTKDFKRRLTNVYTQEVLETDYLSNRLACPSMPLADNITVSGQVTLNGQILNATGATAHQVMLGWLSDVGDCKNYSERDVDKDLTFRIELDAESRQRVWDALWIKTGVLEAEFVPCAQDDDGRAVFETWQKGEKEAKFIEVKDGRETVSSIGDGTHDDIASRWEKIKAGACVSVRGALVVDCLNQCMSCTNASVELHPAYEVKLLETSKCQP